MTGDEKVIKDKKVRSEWRQEPDEEKNLRGLVTLKECYWNGAESGGRCFNDGSIVCKNNSGVESTRVT